ncbi:probable serine/threonine-protein kinase pats1 [Mytilus californianus]|uniref:probable serine/threonine-protein kinase pats1 n=1 Tax=Mytilus californianus TaxID=6549 RepID=UPI0022455D9A|nr:probable serine/threonine-protein kinase pats1 [Mytilus californianus]
MTAASIQGVVLEELRTGKYEVEIAPSYLIDFGGQRSYDMTHQLFIQYQGTFVIIFDGRYGLHQPLKDYPQGDITAEDILVHWVNSILLYCKESDDIMPMILFAATHSDKLKTDVETAKKRFTQELTTLFSTHFKHRHIMYDRIFLVNATNPKDPEIDLLKDTLVDIAFKQTTWGQRKPLTWVPLELQFSEMRTKNVSFISMENLRELNQLNEEFTLSEDSLQDFLRVQNSLGNILYFDNPGLNNLIVVQPTAMVNILKSFITDKHFWPKKKDLRRILKNISSTGKVQREHLFKLWSQPKFHEFVPTDQHKEYIIQVLVHLDILVVPKHNDVCSTNDATYLVPCVVQSKLPAELVPSEEQKTICMAYHLRESIVPTALTFKLVAASVNIWPLYQINGRDCLYLQSAILNIDDSNQLLILTKGQRVIIYLSNTVSKHLISPDVVASIQECLTSALHRVLHFYHECFGKRFVKVDVASLFEAEVGLICNKETCLVRLTVARENKTWLCNNGSTHESKYCLYWFFDKEKKTCNPECKGLNTEALSLHPTDKHFVRLAEQISIAVFDQFIIHLGLTREEWETIEYQFTRNGKLGMQLMALYECEKKKKLTQTMTLQDLLNALKGIDQHHSLCQIVREETNLTGIAESILQETPSEEILKSLTQHLGNCVIQLGIELGLSFNSIEETMYNHPKEMYSQLYNILKKWRQSSKDKPSVYVLMKALRRTDAGGLIFLREQYQTS